MARSDTDALTGLVEGLDTTGPSAMPRRLASPHARVSGVKYNSPDGDADGADVLTTGRAPGWPAPRPETIDLIRDRGVTCVGTDGLSIGSAEGGAPTHLTGLPHGVTLIKALGGLGPDPAAGAWFLFLPLRLADGTGSPGRALAVPPRRRSPVHRRHHDCCRASVTPS